MRFGIKEGLGIISAAFFLGGMFVCARGWFDGRWMILFIGLPFILVVIPDVLKCEGWNGLAKLPLFLCLFILIFGIVVLCADWFLNNHWLKEHQWMVLPMPFIFIYIILKLARR
jgi:hypothetical protein